MATSLGTYVNQSLGWVLAVFGLVVVTLGHALFRTGILGELLLLLGGYAVLQGAFLIIEAWWKRRKDGGA